MALALDPNRTRGINKQIHIRGASINVIKVDGIKHCEKRLPLKFHSFGERSNFPRIWFRDLRFRTWGLEINHLNSHNFVWQGLFFFHYYLARNFDDRLSSNFHRFVILCIRWDTPTVKASLWQLPIVSTACKGRGPFSFYAKSCYLLLWGVGWFKLPQKPNSYIIATVYKYSLKNTNFSG